MLQSSMQVTPTKLELKMASGMSSAPETVKAAELACEQCLSGLHAEVAEDCLRVLVNRVAGQAEAGGRLLVRVALQQTT